MERRMMRNHHVRCEPGEKLEIISKAYLSASPYWNIIQYSDSMYKSSDVIEKYGVDPSKTDLSRIADYDEFVKMMNYCTLKQFTALEKGGRFFILMGDISETC